MSVLLMTDCVVVYYALCFLCEKVVMMVMPPCLPHRQVPVTCCRHKIYHESSESVTLNIRYVAVCCMITV